VAVTADDGFEDFYVSSRQRLVTFVYAISGDLSDAQDVAQETYARAWQRWSTVETYGDPEAWLRTVAYRLLCNRWRKARNRVAAYRRHGSERPVDAPSENTMALVSALRELPEVQREAVVLHHLLDLPVTQVAVETGVPVSTVKTRLARGRRTLATLLSTELAEEVSHA
jgi:RNA polymerase sigma-70 factor (ECF subfamily)